MIHADILNYIFAIKDEGKFIKSASVLFQSVWLIKTTGIKRLANS